MTARARSDKAITDCNKAIELNPRDATGYYNRGGHYRAKGQHEAAIADYQQGHPPRPEAEEALHARISRPRSASSSRLSNSGG